MLTVMHNISLYVYFKILSCCTNFVVIHNIKKEIRSKHSLKKHDTYLLIVESNLISH